MLTVYRKMLAILLLENYYAAAEEEGATRWRN